MHNPHSISKPSFVRIQEIEACVKKGYTDLEEFMSATGLKNASIVKYARLAGIELPFLTMVKRAYKSKHTRIQEIEECIKKGYTEPEQFISETGLKIDAIIMYSRKGGIELPFRCKDALKHQKCSRSAGRDEMIGRGYSEVEIAEAEGVTRECVRRYIVSSGQHERWKELSRIRRGIISEFGASLENMVRQSLVDCLTNITYSKASDAERFAIDRIMEYSTRPDQIPLIPKYMTYFTLYKKASDDGERPFNNELAREAEVKATTIGHIMKVLGVKKFHECKEHVKTPKWKIDVIKRVCQEPYSQSDVAYFLGLDNHIVHKIRKESIRQAGLDDHPKFRYIKQFGYRSSIESLSFRVASQIYEASDLGFNEQDISELTDRSVRVVRYTLQNRQSISPKITAILKDLYQKDFDKPYLDCEQRRK